jgi:hypothetical protein
VWGGGKGEKERERKKEEEDSLHHRVRVIPEGRLVLIFNWYTNFFALQFQLIYFADPVPPDILSGHTSKG